MFQIRNRQSEIRNGKAHASQKALSVATLRASPPRLKAMRVQAKSNSQGGKMKDRSPFRDPLKNNWSRRKFLGRTASAAVGLSIIPRHVLGGPGYVPPSEKINVAFIGVGAQGLRVMLNFLKQPDVQAVSVCDPNKGSGDYPQWDDSEFCKSVRRLLGVSSGWEWLSPNQPIQLTHSMRVTCGMAGREPCQKIVDSYYGTQKRSGKYRGCTAYRDFRELLEKEKDIDA